MQAAVLAPLLLLLAAPAAAEVPFVGCASDGQVGAVAAPARGEVDHIPAAAAPGLAYYGTRSLGALAPRGWHCFALSGSGGEYLLITPERHGSTDLLGRAKGVTKGPAVAVGVTYGFTSGRFEVARTIARLFPRHQDFVREVQALDTETALLPNHPYPADALVRLGDEAIAFTTPANKKGLGTTHFLLPARDPITGLVILLPDEDMSMLELSVRLPRKDKALERFILEGTAARSGVALPRTTPR
ncbi:MAG TPA: hypothetical protein VF680_06285 [Allosphingosinicella sp.]|jgi:hypothetical protein